VFLQTVGNHAKGEQLRLRWAAEWARTFGPAWCQLTAPVGAKMLEDLDIRPPSEEDLRAAERQRSPNGEARRLIDAILGGNAVSWTADNPA
jgi:hypothetical protein